MKTPPLSGPRAVIADLVRDNPNGVTYKVLADACGRNPTYFQQFVTKGSPRVLPEADRKKAAEILEIDEARLMTDDQIKAVGKPSGTPIRRTSQQHLTSRDLPIMGRARAAADDALILEGGMVGTTERPSYLAGVDDAFAVYIVGDSMYPRFKHGELAYVNPHKPAVAEDDILIEFLDGTGIVKEMVKIQGNKLLARQHNPKRELTYDLKTIKAIHLIEGRGPR